MIIGKEITFGDDFVEESSKDFDVNINELMNYHAFVQGQTGSGKTNLILELIDKLVKERPETQLVIIDDQEEFTFLPRYFSNVIEVSKKKTPKVFTVDHGWELGIQSRRKSQSLILNLSGFKERADREKFVQNFLEGFWSDRKEGEGIPCLLIIDEADLFVPTRSKRKNVASREIIVDYAKRARKYNISLLLATQYSASVEIDARREMENYFIGRTKERRDRNAVCEMLGDNSIFDNLGWGLKQGQFYVRGNALSQDLKLMHSNVTRILKKTIGVKEEEQFGDLSAIYEKSVTEKNDLTLIDMLKQKIQELENELRIAKSKELTDEIRQSLMDMGFNEGLSKAKKQYEEEKGKLSRFMEKL